MIKIERNNIIWIKTRLGDLEDGDPFYTKPEMQWGVVHDFFMVPLANNAKWTVLPEPDFRFVLIESTDERKRVKYEFTQFHKDYVCFVGLAAEEISKYLKPKQEDSL